MNRTFFPEKRPRWLWFTIEFVTAASVGALSMFAHWGQLYEQNIFLAGVAWGLGFIGFSRAIEIATPAPTPSVTITVDRSRVSTEQEADFDEAVEDFIAACKKAGAIK